MSPLALLAVLAPGIAAAQEGFDAHGFDPAVSDGDVRDLLQTWRPETQVPGAVGLSLLGEYAKAPLVLVVDDGTRQASYRLLDDVVALNTGVHVGLHERIGVAVGAPVFLGSRGIGGVGNGLGFGDVTVSVPVGIVLPEDDQGFGLSVVPVGILPTGDASAFLGAGTVAGGLHVASGVGLGRLTLVGNTGIEVNRSRTYRNLGDAPRLVAAVGASLALSESVGLGLEADLRGALAKNPFRGTGSPGETVLHVRGRTPFGLTWTVGGALGMTRGQSAAQYRLFAGAGWVFGKNGPRDIDGDGFVGAADQCEEEPETFNGHRDDDGCPDRLATFALVVKDPEGAPLPGAIVTRDGEEIGTTDAAGRLVLRDLLPGEALLLSVDHGAALYVPAQVETPELVEGDQEQEVQLQWRPGTVRVVTRDQAGAPVDAKLRFDGPETYDDLLLGADGEETFVLPPGEWSIFATAPQYGTARRDVVLAANENLLTVIEFELEPAVTVVTETGVVILEPVQFAFDSAQLLPASERVLEQVANDIRTTPEIRVIEVQGHTSTEGSARYNRELSQRRVDSVVQYLVDRGVDPNRLIGIGYGERCPAVEEVTEADRAKNRRVQFFVVEPEPEGGIPCHMGVPGQLDEIRFEYERRIER